MLERESLSFRLSCVEPDRLCVAQPHPVSQVPTSNTLSEKTRRMDFLIWTPYHADAAGSEEKATPKNALRDHQNVTPHRAGTATPRPPPRRGSAASSGSGRAAKTGRNRRANQERNRPGEGQDRHRPWRAVKRK